MATYSHNTSDVTTVMTSNTAPSPFVVSASSEFNAGYAAWRAFDHLSGSGGSNAWACTGTTGWLKIFIGTACVVTSYTLTASADSQTMMARDWTLQGSNNDATWTIIHSTTNQTGWSAAEMRTYTITSPENYSYYKLDITANNGDTSIIVGELELLKTYAHNSNDLTPVMTSNTTPSPVVVSASTEYNSSYAAWKAFDHLGGTSGWASTVGNTGWLKVYSGGDLWTVTYYTITSCTDSLVAMAKDWTLQGSTDNNSWVTLDTRTSQISWASDDMRTYAITSPGNYSYYKLDITDNCGNPDATEVGELELVGTIYVAPTPPPSSKVPSGDIVPRSNGFGSLGTSIKKWLNGYFYNIFATGGTISGVNMISDSGETISGPVTTSAGIGDARKLVALSSTGKIDSTMISGTIGGSSYVGLTWNMATSSIPVLANNGYFLNPTANITLTLPASPSVGDPINIVDIYNKASTYVITVAHNGNNIEGVAEDLIINIDGAGISLVYADAVRGWELVSEVGRRAVYSTIVNNTIYNTISGSSSGGDSFLVSQIFS